MAITVLNTSLNESIPSLINAWEWPNTPAKSLRILRNRLPKMVFLPTIMAICWLDFWVLLIGISFLLVAILFLCSCHRRILISSEKKSLRETVPQRHGSTLLP